MIFFLKWFIITVGFWMLVDGIVSLKSKSVGHTFVSDVFRFIRSLLGAGLVAAGILI
jgi:hypothetical protein